MLPFRNEDEERPMNPGFGGFQSLAPMVASQFQGQPSPMAQAQPVSRMNPAFESRQQPSPRMGLFGRNRRLGMRG